MFLQLTERIETLLKRKVELESGGLAGEIRKADEQVSSQPGPAGRDEGRSDDG